MCLFSCMLRRFTGLRCFAVRVFQRSQLHYVNVTSDWGNLAKECSDVAPAGVEEGCSISLVAAVVTRTSGVFLAFGFFFFCCFSAARTILWVSPRTLLKISMRRCFEMFEKKAYIACSTSKVEHFWWKTGLLTELKWCRPFVDRILDWRGSCWGRACCSRRGDDGSDGPPGIVPVSMAFNC